MGGSNGALQKKEARRPPSEGCLAVRVNAAITTNRTVLEWGCHRLCGKGDFRWLNCVGRVVFDG